MIIQDKNDERISPNGSNQNDNLAQIIQDTSDIIS